MSKDGTHHEHPRHETRCSKSSAKRWTRDVIAVTPPEVGAAITAGEACGEIESTKSLSDLISPITGTVELRNDDLLESPELVNSDPYGKGWIFEARVEPATLAEQLALLMDAGAYRESTGE